MPAMPTFHDVLVHVDYFGHVKIEGRTGVMTVSHRDLSGAVLHRLELTPER